MHTFISTLLTALTFLLIPSFAFAQTTTPPPDATPGSYPTATPPTKAPTKILPPAPLPRGTLVAPTEPTATSSAMTTTSPGVSEGENQSPLYILLGLGVLALIGLGSFFFLRRKNELPPTSSRPFPPQPPTGV